MEIQLHCDIDESGNISTVLAGENIIPNRKYDYFFMVNSWDIIENIYLYKIVDGQLVLK